MVSTAVIVKEDSSMHACIVIRYASVFIYDKIDNKKAVLSQR